jgi:hypothetical protein
MLHTLRFSLQNTVYFIMLPFLVHVFTIYIQVCWNLNVKFKVCKFVHHRTIQINHQPDATVFQFITLTFVYTSACLRRFPAHHQELNDYSGSHWSYLRIVVIVVLCSWSGSPAGPTTNTTWLSPRYEGKTRGCHCSHWAPDDRRKKRPKHVELQKDVRIINWKIFAPGWWFIWIVRWCTDLQTLNFTFKF